MKKDIPLVIGFSKPKGKIFPIYSWLIRLFQGNTKYSHVYIRWYSKKADAHIHYHASGRSVHFLCKEEFDKHIDPIEEYEVRISDEGYAKLLHFCMTNAGKDYGLQQAVGIAWVYINKLFGKKIKNPWADGNKSWICSELVGSIIVDVIGSKMESGVFIELDSADPKDIKNIVANLPKVTRL